MYSGSPAAANAVIIIATILTLITVIIYIEEVIFAMKNFKVNRDRKVKTMWILAAYPVSTLMSTTVDILCFTTTSINSYSK